MYAIRSYYEEIANKIDNEPQLSNWRDWKWQIKHSIKSLDKFELITGIKFNKKERSDLEKTFKKFPLSITPYYLSVIDRSNYQNDPVFKQAFGGIEELTTLSSELADPLSEDKDSPVDVITSYSIHYTKLYDLQKVPISELVIVASLLLFSKLPA